MVGSIALGFFTAVACAGVKEDLAEATRLLKTAQEESALAVLTRALDRPGLAPGERAEAYVLLGIARVNLRDEEGASLAFQRAAEADANAVLPPKIAPPRARELFEAAKENVKKQAAAKPPPPAPAPAPVIAPVPPSIVERPSRALRTVSYVTAAVAAATLGVGIFFGVQSRSQFGQISGADRNMMGLITGINERDAAPIYAQGAQNAIIA